MDNIVPLTSGEVDKVVVSRLEFLLKEARKGSLQNLAFIGLCSDGRIIDCVSMGNTPFTTMGAVHMLADRISDTIKQAFDEEEYTDY